MAERFRDRKPIPKPVPAYLPTAGSPLKVDRELYGTIRDAPRVLVTEFTLPIRSGRAWDVPAGCVVKISTPEGPQVGSCLLSCHQGSGGQGGGRGVMKSVTDGRARLRQHGKQAISTSGTDTTPANDSGPPAHASCTPPISPHSTVSGPRCLTCVPSAPLSTMASLATGLTSTVGACTISSARAATRTSTPCSRGVRSTTFTATRTW